MRNDNLLLDIEKAVKKDPTTLNFLKLARIIMREGNLRVVNPAAAVAKKRLSRYIHEERWRAIDEERKVLDEERKTLASRQMRLQGRLSNASLREKRWSGEMLI
jgi:hypothetical protein